MFTLMSPPRPPCGCCGRLRASRRLFSPYECFVHHVCPRTDRLESPSPLGDGLRTQGFTASVQENTQEMSSIKVLLLCFKHCKYVWLLDYTVSTQRVARVVRRHLECQVTLIGPPELQKSPHVGRLSESCCLLVFRAPRSPPRTCLLPLWIVSLLHV